MPLLFCCCSLHGCDVTCTTHVLSFTAVRCHAVFTCRPRYVVGIVEITEEDDSSTSPAESAQQQAQARLQAALLQVLLACALYAQQDIKSDDSKQLQSNTASSSSSSGHLYADLDSFCSSTVLQGLLLSTPWSSKACQQQCHCVLQQLAGAAAAAAHPAAPAAELQQQQQQGCWRQLLSRLLPQLLDCLRDTLMAQHRHNRAQDRGELGRWPDVLSSASIGCFVR